MSTEFESKMARRSAGEVEQDECESASRASVARRAAERLARSPAEVAAAVAAIAEREAAIAAADAAIYAAEYIIKRAKRGSPEQIDAGKQLEAAHTVRRKLF